MARPFAPAILLLSACAAPPAGEPSLAPRAAEAIDPRVPIPNEVAATPADGALVARLAELVAEASRGDAAFRDAAAEAERLAGQAGEPQSESWVAAQQALSAALAARAPTTRAMADIDALAANAIGVPGRATSGNLAAIEDAAGRVGAIDRGQAERLAAIQARLGG